jgi:hypothetical protein
VRTVVVSKPQSSQRSTGQRQGIQAEKPHGVSPRQGSARQGGIDAERPHGVSAAGFGDSRQGSGAGGGRRDSRPGDARTGSSRSDDVVHKPDWTPKGWNPDAHRNDLGYPGWHPSHWGAGVFYYTPPSTTTIVEHNYYGDTVEQYDAPEREYDRRKSLSVGLRAGSLGGAMEGGFNPDSVDMGLSLGYRVFDPVGLELSFLRAAGDELPTTESPVQASAHLFLFPWTQVSPYLTAGMSSAPYEGAKNQSKYQVPDGYAYGPHGGVGVELGIGDHFSLNAEGRYTKFQNVESSKTHAAVGLNYYF